MATRRFRPNEAESVPDTGYSILCKLTDGAYGEILQVVCHSDQKQYAAKVMTMDSGNVIQRWVQAEMDALFRLQHENIILVKEVFVETTAKAFWLVMELADLGSVEDYVSTSGALPDGTLESYISQLSLGMEYVHANQFAHGDVTPRNLLLFSSGVLKIADFGQSIPCQGDGKTVRSGNLAGDPRYVAPEAMRGVNYDPQLSDVWSVGCCLYFMFTARHLYQGSEKDIKRCQMKGKIFFPGEEFYYQKYTKLRDIIWRLTQYDPLLRPVFDQWSADGLIAEKVPVI